jgi:hypothetical protein
MLHADLVFSTVNTTQKEVDSTDCQGKCAEIIDSKADGDEVQFSPFGKTNSGDV